MAADGSSQGNVPLIVTNIADKHCRQMMIVAAERSSKECVTHRQEVIQALKLSLL
jgi:hypothetical protein